MKLLKLGGGALAVSLIATALVVATAAGAEAHTSQWTNTCSTVTVDATNFAAAVPATEGTPGTPGQPYIAPTPGTPAIPAVPGTPEIPATPTTYVQLYKFVFKGYGQNNGDKFEWHAADWTSPGWEKTGEHKDSDIVLTLGTPEVPATPGTPAVPAVPGTPGQPYIAPTPAIPGTDAKTNHETVYIDGAAVSDADFSTEFHATFPLGAADTSHTYRVVLTAWDNPKYDADSGTISVAACQVPVLKPVATITLDNCIYDAYGVPNDRPTVLTYDNTKSNEAVLFSVTGYSQFDRTVDAGQIVTVPVPFSTLASGTLTVTAAGQTFTLNVPECATAGPKPAPVVETSSKTVTNCDTELDTTTTVTTTTDWYLYLDEAGKLSWVKGEPVPSESVVTTTKVTAKECPTNVVALPLPKPTTPPAATPSPVAPSTPIATVDSSQQLAHTGSNIPEWVLWAIALAFLAGVAFLVWDMRRKGRTE